MLWWFATITAIHIKSTKFFTTMRKLQASSQLGNISETRDAFPRTLNESLSYQ
jgi:hypothetical protein